MIAPLESITLNLSAAANGTPGIQISDIAGNMVFIDSAGGPFSMRFDSGPVFPVPTEGFKFTPGGFSKITFYNFNAFPIALVVYIGQAGVDYVGANINKNAPTDALGNFGIIVAGDIPKVFGQKVSSLGAFGNRGHNYVVGDQLTTPDGTGTKAVFQVGQVAPNGSIQTLLIVDPGNYSVLPATPSALIGGAGTQLSVGLNFGSLTGAVLGVAASGLLTITAAAPLIIPNGLSLNARKSITLKCDAASAVALKVLDKNGAICRSLAAGEVETFDTPAALQIIGAAGTATFSSRELYYL